LADASSNAKSNELLRQISSSCALAPLLTPPPGFTGFAKLSTKTLSSGFLSLILNAAEKESLFIQKYLDSSSLHFFLFKHSQILLT